MDVKDILKEYGGYEESSAPVSEETSDFQYTGPDLQFAGTTGRSARNNNFLNIEYHPGWQERHGATLEPEGRFSTYPDAMSGYKASLELLHRYKTNRVMPQPGGHTLESFVYNFSPPHQNPTEKLIEQYSKSLGVGRKTSLADIPVEKLFVPMAARESETKVLPIRSESEATFEDGSARANKMAVSRDPKEDELANILEEYGTPKASADTPASTPTPDTESATATDLMEGTPTFTGAGGDFGSNFTAPLNWYAKNLQTAFNEPIPPHDVGAGGPLEDPGMVGAAGGLFRAATVDPALKALGLLHEKVVDPYVVQPLQAALEKRGMGKVDTPAMSMLAPEVAPYMEDLGQDIPVPLAKIVAEGAGLGADVPVYGGAIKLLRTLANASKAATAVGATERAAGMDVINEILAKANPQATAATAKLRYGPGRGVYGNYPKAEEAMAKEATAAIKESLGKETYWKGVEENIRNQQKYRTAKGTEGTPFRAKEVTEDLTYATPITNDAVLRGLGVSPGKNPPNELLDATLGRGELPVQVKKFYSGGPETDEVLAHVRAAASEPGATTASIIAQVSGRLGVTPDKVLSTLASVNTQSKAAQPARVGEVANELTKAIDKTNEPIASVISTSEYGKSLPSIRDVGIDTPAPPNFPSYTHKASDPLKDIGGFQREVSPSATSARNWQQGPIEGFAEAQRRTIFESAYYRKHLNSVFEDAGLMDDVKASVQEGKKLIGPISKKLQTSNKEVMKLESEADSLQRKVKSLDTRSDSYANAKEQLSVLETRLKALKEKNKPVEEKIYAELNQAVNTLQEKYANVRIKRAADGDVGAEALLSPKEKEVADKLRALYKQYGERFEKQGVPVFKDKPYTNYVYEWSGYEPDKGMDFFGKKLFWQKDTPPALLKFLSRDKRSKDWFPFAYQSMDTYLGAASRKLHFNPFYSEWTPKIDSWKAIGDYPGAAKWLQGFLKRNMSGPQTELFDKMANSVANFEYGHYLMGNLSPGVLHLFKVFNSPIEHGFWNAAKGLGGIGRGLAEKGLHKLGVTDKPGSYQRILEYYITSPQLIQALEQSPAWSGVTNASTWANVRNNPLLNPTRVTEYFDRGVGTLAAVTRGVGKGASAEQINRAISDSLMSINFFGWDNPRVMSGGGQFGGLRRAAFMFQQQPTKIWEYRANILSDALTGRKDVYGDSHIPKLIRMIVTLGAVDAAGTAAGFDLHRHLFHVPFTKDTAGGGTTVNLLPPWAQYLATAQKSGVKAGAEEFLKWGGTVQKLLTPPEQTPSKYGSKAMWQLGLPKKGWREEAQARESATDYRHKKQAMRKTVRETEKPSPLGQLLRWGIWPTPIEGGD